ncbi:hypothetical protein Barb4_00356 [Bacteroidales bacterium Barb4]|nr:hypothetical protein Barb4_00356 [Bacteroidales bacterium Barb4]
MKYRRFRILAFLTLLPVAAAHAQEGKTWSLQYSGSPFIAPILTSNPSGIHTGTHSSAFAYTGEYYLSEKWHLQGGYFRTDISYGNAERTMEGWQSGVKRYFLDPHFVFQPYVSGAVQLNWSRHTENIYLPMHQGTINPRLSLVPGIGAEFYMFSSVAFMIEYDFNMGLHSSTALDVQRADRIADKGMFHHLQLGVKVAFPLRFTEEDGQMVRGFLSAVWSAMWDAILHND